MSEGRILNWDDEVDLEKNDAPEFVILPDGDYPFRITGFERGTFPGSAKLPECPKAMLTIVCDGGKAGNSIVYEDLILFSTLEWKLASFARSIGIDGERVKIPWKQLQGRTGKVRLKTEEYTTRDGRQGRKNRVQAWLRPDSSAKTDDGADDDLDDL